MARTSGASIETSRWRIDLWKYSWSIRGQNIYVNTSDRQKRIVNWSKGSIVTSAVTRRCGIFSTRIPQKHSSGSNLRPMHSALNLHFQDGRRSLFAEMADSRCSDWVICSPRSNTELLSFKSSSIMNRSTSSTSNNRKRALSHSVPDSRIPTLPKWLRQWVRKGYVWKNPAMLRTVSLKLYHMGTDRSLWMQW